MRPTMGYRNTTPAVNIGIFQPLLTVVYRISVLQIQGTSVDLANVSLTDRFLLKKKKKNYAKTGNQTLKAQNKSSININNIS